MKRLFLLATVGALVSGLTACAETSAPKTASTSATRKNYQTAEPSLGSHLRRQYSDDQQATGISAAAPAGDRTFANSSAGGSYAGQH